MAGQLAAGSHPQFLRGSKSTLQRTRSRLHLRSHCKTRRFAQNIQCSIPRRKLVPGSSSTCIPLGHQSQSIRSLLRRRKRCCCHSIRHRTSWSTECHRSNIQPHPRAMEWAIHSSSPGSVRVSDERILHRLPRTTYILLRSRKHNGCRSSSGRMTTSSESFQHSILPPRRWVPESSQSPEAVS